MNMDWVYANSRERRIGHLKTKYGMNVGRILGVAVLAISSNGCSSRFAIGLRQPLYLFVGNLCDSIQHPENDDYVLAFIMGSTLDSLEQVAACHCCAYDHCSKTVD